MLGFHNKTSFDTFWKVTIIRSEGSQVIPPGTETLQGAPRCSIIRIIAYQIWETSTSVNVWIRGTTLQPCCLINTLQKVQGIRTNLAVIYDQTLSQRYDKRRAKSRIWPRETSLVPRPLSFFCVGVGKERFWAFAVTQNHIRRSTRPFLSLPQHKRKRSGHETSVLEVCPPSSSHRMFIMTITKYPQVHRD